MNTFLWSAQVMVAAVFAVTGMVKLTQPRLKMASGPMTWAAAVSDPQFRAVGLLEVLGAAGLILPVALNIAPILSAIAALALAAMMVGAALTHLRLHELNRLAAPVLLVLLTLSIAAVRIVAYRT